MHRATNYTRVRVHVCRQAGSIKTTCGIVHAGPLHGLDKTKESVGLLLLAVAACLRLLRQGSLYSRASSAEKSALYSIVRWRCITSPSSTSKAAQRKQATRHHNCSR